MGGEARIGGPGGHDPVQPDLGTEPLHDGLHRRPGGGAGHLRHGQAAQQRPSGLADTGPPGQVVADDVDQRSARADQRDQVAQAVAAVAAQDGQGLRG